MTNKSGNAHLVEAAKQFYGRGAAWNPIPIYYNDGNLSRPPTRTLNFDSWSSVQRVFDRKKFDALGLLLTGNPFSWLDIDEESLYQHWQRKVSPIIRTLPTVQTSRGRHVICRLAEPIAKAHNLRNFGFEGEVRGGNCLVVVPPSEHRSCDLYYKWVYPLPENDSDLPIISLEELLPFDRVGSRLSLSLSRPERLASSGTVSTADSAKPNVYPISVCETIDDIILSCLPTAKGTRRIYLCEMMRRMKRLKKEWSKSALQEVAKKYVSKAHSYTRDKSGKETLDCLVCLHDHFDEEAGLVSRAVGALPTTELVQVPKMYSYACSQLRVARLATFCSLMQSLTTETVWWLSCRDVARIIGPRSPSKANSYLKSLEHAGLLECVDRGTPGKVVGGHAASYIWLGAPTKVIENDNDQESIQSSIGNIGVAY